MKQKMPDRILQV